MRHGPELCCGGPDLAVSTLAELGELAERAYLREVADAGATWWLEYVPAGDPATMRAAVARGPLR
jgi:hypothetical protein